jgi:hypothetical protein
MNADVIEINLTFRCGHTQAIQSPGPIDPGGEWRRYLGQTPGENHRAHDAVESCGRCRGRKAN